MVCSKNLVNEFFNNTWGVRSNTAIAEVTTDPSNPNFYWFFATHKPDQFNLNISIDIKMQYVFTGLVKPVP